MKLIERIQMIHKLFLSSIFTLLILEISIPLENKAGNKNNLINKFCIATIKSKLTFKDKEELDKISHFTCECFFEKYKSGSTLKNSRIFCKDKASEKYNL